MHSPIRITVNGAAIEVHREPDRSLLAVLRTEAGLTGAKYACGEGVCGACTVLVDGGPVHACVLAISEVDQHAVTTIEGLADGDKLHAVQRAFVELGATQCGYCSPGMVMRTVALLAEEPDPTEAQILAALQGNICRCGAYRRILRAVRLAAEYAQAGDRFVQVESGTRPDVLLGDPAELKWPWDLQPIEERRYFDLLPEGLVVVLPPGEAPKRRVRQPGLWRANGGAWIHIGADGLVAAFTGKVDVGQDNRIALSL